MTNTFDRLRTIRQLSERNPAFTEPAIRWLVFNAKHNGLERAIVRIGKPGSRRPKVLIDEAEFSRWLDAQVGGHRVPA
jgi:hypothetical protein